MKRKIALVLSALLILCVFAACGEKAEIIAEKTDAAITHQFPYFSPSGGLAPRITLMYNGKDAPENLHYSIKADDGYFHERIKDEDKMFVFETRDDLTAETDFYWEYLSREYVTIENNEYVYKEESANIYFTGDSVFLETIIYDGDTIIGYGVSKICAAPIAPASTIPEGAEGVMRMYMPIEIESAVFPRVDGKYQDVSEKDVQELISKAKEAGKDAVPEDLKELLKNKDL